MNTKIPETARGGWDAWHKRTTDVFDEPSAGWDVLELLAAQSVKK